MAHKKFDLYVECYWNFILVAHFGQVQNKSVYLFQIYEILTFGERMSYIPSNEVISVIVD